jgi:hypothetical protein
MVNDSLNTLHRPPFDCECGKGVRVMDAQGSEVCTHTLAVFAVQNGYVPQRWLPLRAVSARRSGDGGGQHG